MKSLSTPHLKSELLLSAYVRRHTASLKEKLVFDLADVVRLVSLALQNTFVNCSNLNGMATTK